MKKLILILIAAIGGYFFFEKLGLLEKMSFIFEPQITINDLQSRPSIYADSIVILRNLRIKGTRSLLNYTHSKVSDGTGEIVLLSSRPYTTGEEVKEVKGRFTVLYADDERRFEVFISEDLKLARDLMKVIKHTLLF